MFKQTLAALQRPLPPTPPGGGNAVWGEETEVGGPGRGPSLRSRKKGVKYLRGRAGPCKNKPVPAPLFRLECLPPSPPLLEAGGGFVCALTLPYAAPRPILTYLPCFFNPPSTHLDHPWSPMLQVEYFRKVKCMFHRAFYFLLLPSCNVSAAFAFLLGNPLCQVPPCGDNDFWWLRASNLSYTVYKMPFVFLHKDKNPSLSLFKDLEMYFFLLMGERDTFPPPATCILSFFTLHHLL